MEGKMIPDEKQELIASFRESSSFYVYYEKTFKGKPKCTFVWSSKPPSFNELKRWRGNIITYKIFKYIQSNIAIFR